MLPLHHEAIGSKTGVIISQRGLPRKRKNNWTAGGVDLTVEKILTGRGRAAAPRIGETRRADSRLSVAVECRNCSSRSFRDGRRLLRDDLRGVRRRA